METEVNRHPEVTVALQGTLDTFALPDVLRLLASTKKTGRLRVSGTRGSGSVWVDSGGVVATEASGAHHATTAVEVVFELLRYRDGSFTFENDTAAPDPEPPTDVEPLLGEAELLLGEWQEIEAVVPSLDAWVSLRAELPRADVVVDAARWKLVVAVGGGTSVGQLGDVLVLSEVPVCRAVKDLVELGLASVDASRAPSAEARRPVFDDAFVAPARAELDALAERIGGDGIGFDDGLPPLNGFGRHEASPPAGAGEAVAEPAEPMLPQLAPRPVRPVTVFEPDEANEEEVARQLANLSPKAARAVAAAAQAVTDEERDAALALVTGEDDEPINRGLLLKFLSSVRS